MSGDSGPLYRAAGVALLRAAARPPSAGPGWWPDLDDDVECAAWLREAWSRRWFADGVRAASPSLAHRMERVRLGDGRRLRRTVLASARYLMRAAGRPTPFGLFAGVAEASFGPAGSVRAASVRAGTADRPVARADTQWLADVVDRLETAPELLERLDVVFTDLAVELGGWLEAPSGPNRVRIRRTPFTDLVRDAAASPIRFSELADCALEVSGSDDRTGATAVLRRLVEQRVLVTALRAPFTEADPLRHVVRVLHEAGAGALPDAAPVLRELGAVQDELARHNEPGISYEAASALRDEVGVQMRRLSFAGRTPLAVDLRLDRMVRLPGHVADEVAAAAGALLRLSRHPGGLPVWRDYHAVFVDRYGTGTLVPVLDVVHPGSGIGYPAGYRGSVLPAPAEQTTERDGRLLALAWEAVNAGRTEVVLDDRAIDALRGGQELDASRVPPHVELAARIEAADVEALNRGDYAVRVAPARAGGVLTSRFTATATGSGLAEVYAALPTATAGALPVQLSFHPAYPHAENICRVPAYLPTILPLGEHRSCGDQAQRVMRVEELAVTADHDRLHLVDLVTRRAVEPQVFHALALDKQAPPLARFLASLPRRFAAAWTVLDWGPLADALPFLPGVRYGQAVLAPARWRLDAAYLPGQAADLATWTAAVDGWRDRWRCPDRVDLRDDDRTLLLDLGEPVHAAILRAHLARHGHAVLTEPAGEAGWIGGVAHEVAIPLVSSAPPVPPPPGLAAAPIVLGRSGGRLPGAAGTEWLQAHLYAHPELHDQLLADRLPQLLADLGASDDEPTRWWFIRYRSSREPDHLRLRLRAGPGGYGSLAAAVSGWAEELRQDGLASGLVLAEYRPETGRYGDGPAMQAVESVFAADSAAAVAALRAGTDVLAAAAAGVVDLTTGLLGASDGLARLIAEPVPPAGGVPVSRVVADIAARLSQGDDADEELTDARQLRARALTEYRRQLPTHLDPGAVLESLAHMHCNRLLGVDPDQEQACRRLARRAALTLRARRTAAS